MQVCISLWIIAKIKTREMCVLAKFAKISSRENFYLYSKQMLVFVDMLILHALVASSGDLLHTTSNLIDTILDIDEEILTDWANTILIQGVAEAMKQVK